MNERQLVRASLERIRDQFALARDGKIRVFTLSVIVRGQADGLRGYRPDVAEPLLGLAAALDALCSEPRPDVTPLEQRFDAWRKDTLAVLVAEEAAVAPAPASPPAKPAAKAARAEAPAPKPAQVPAPEPSGGALEPEGAPMSAEEIQRILDGLRKG